MIIKKICWEFEFGLYDKKTHSCLDYDKTLYQCMFVNKKVYNSVCHRKNMRLHFEPFYGLSMFSITKI